MSGLISRMTMIFQAKASKALDNAENPNETLDYSYERQLELLRQTKQSIATVATAKTRLQLQAAKLAESVSTLEQQAATALEGGSEDLARVALERKALAQQQLAGLDTQAAELANEQQKLSDTERRLASKVEAFRTQKEVLKAQYSAAEAQVKIADAQTGLSEEFADVGLAVDRARDKTEQMRARALAMGELIDTGVLDDATVAGGDDLDRQLAQISASQSVEGDLARLRAQLATAPPQAQLAPPATGKAGSERSTP